MKRNLAGRGLMSDFRIEGERREDRNTPFHKRILSVEPIPNTKSGHWGKLECGHRVMLFGDYERLDGVALCMHCRDDKELDDRS